MTEIEFVQKIQSLNGEVYLVGGYVRDLYMNKQPNDKDYVICYVNENNFINIFPKAQKIGNLFPVYILTIDNQKCEIAFARTERKTSTGYTGFTTFTDNVSIEQDLYRRDLTVNALALRLPDKVLIDPFNGLEDIKKKAIRHVSSHFRDDPVRSLRAARFASIWNYNINLSTITMMKKCRNELMNEPKERLLKELIKVLHSPKPSIFFQYLHQTNLLNITFPSFTWDDINLLDKIRTDKTINKFLILTLHSNLNDRIIYPNTWIKAYNFMHSYLKEQLTDTELINALFTIPKLIITYDDWQLIYTAVFNKPLMILNYVNELMPILQSVRGEHVPNNLKNQEIGKWILTQRINLLNEFILKKVF